MRGVVGGGISNNSGEKESGIRTCRLLSKDFGRMGWGDVLHDEPFQHPLLFWNQQKDVMVTKQKDKERGRGRRNAGFEKNVRSGGTFCFIYKAALRRERKKKKPDAAKQPPCDGDNCNHIENLIRPSVNLKVAANICRPLGGFSPSSTDLEMFHIICMRFTSGSEILTDAASKV